MVKVSVIVPVYNAEKYLHKCLDSLVNQTLNDIEIVLVNDGSTDNSGEILKEYPTTIFHVDGTQAIGKIPVSLENIDLYSMSSHKFFGLKGVGCLIKKNNKD